MTYESNEPYEAFAGQRLFLDQGPLREMLEAMVRQVIEEELTRFLGAGRYERTQERRGHRNGTKPRTMKTSVGKLEFAVPQVREGGFFPSVFERYQRSDRALVAAMQEMVAQGVSTRRVSAVLEEMAGFEISAATVSRAMAELDEQIAQWRKRRLGQTRYPYLIIDARYENVRVEGRVVSQALLIAAGVNAEGRRELLGYWTGDSESEATWSEAVQDLKRRGLQGVEMVISDAHSGIRAALKRHMQGVVWQRCRVHLMRDLFKLVHKRDRGELRGDLRAIFMSESAARCREVAEEIATKWDKRAPKMSKALREGIEDCLSAKTLGPCRWPRLSSTNMMERLMKEIKRRTQVVGVFPNRASLERLAGALLIEMEEKWAQEKARYIVFDES